MTTSVRWLDARISQAEISVLAKRMQSDRLKPKGRSGFRLVDVRRGLLRGSYFERTEIVHTSLDPFGKSKTFRHLDYRSVDFVLTSNWPSIEIRSGIYSTLLRKMKEYLGPEFGVSKIDGDLLAWLAAIEETTSAFKIVRIDLDSVGLSSFASGFVRIEGDQDVRKLTNDFIGSRDHRLLGAVLRWRPSALREISCEIRKVGTLRILEGAPEGAIEVVRQALRRSLGPGSSTFRA